MAKFFEIAFPKKVNPASVKCLLLPKFEIQW